MMSSKLAYPSLNLGFQLFCVARVSKARQKIEFGTVIRFERSSRLEFSSITFPYKRILTASGL
jgi:hypothetical protein